MEPGNTSSKININIKWSTNSLFFSEEQVMSAHAQYVDLLEYWSIDFMCNILLTILINYVQDDNMFMWYEIVNPVLY